MSKNLNLKTKRAYRVRNKIRKDARKNNKLRLSVFRSGKHIYGQIINDNEGVTLLSVSTVQKDVKDNSKLKSFSTTEAAEKVGKLIAEKAKAQGIKEVIFDRGPYLYHGRVKALADSARANGLKC